MTDSCAPAHIDEAINRDPDTAAPPRRLVELLAGSAYDGEAVIDPTG